jgi:hypothetical protein
MLVRNGLAQYQMLSRTQAINAPGVYTMTLVLARPQRLLTISE